MILARTAVMVLVHGILLVLLPSPHVEASSVGSTQHPLKRDDIARHRPHIDFVAAPDAPPVLVESEYNQFAPRSHRHHTKHEKHGLKKHMLESWLHKLGLHANKGQVDTLYREIEKKVHHRHRGTKHGGKEKGERPAWKVVYQKGEAGGVRGSSGQGNYARPVHVGVLPPGIGKPRGWADEGEQPWTPPTTKDSSPIAAALAPLPEPATAPTRTASRRPSDAQPHPDGSSIHPPLPAAGVSSSDHNNSSTPPPLTTPPSASSSSVPDSGTSGSLNPSSTPAPAVNKGEGADERLNSLSSNSSGKSIAGIPIAKDDEDGDAKAPKPQLSNSTSGVGGQSANSAAGRSMDLDMGSWTGAAVGVGVLVTVLLFAV